MRNEGVSQVIDGMKQRSFACLTVGIGDQERASIRCLHLVAGSVEDEKLIFVLLAIVIGALRGRSESWARCCDLLRLPIGRRQRRLNIAPVDCKFCNNPLIMFEIVRFNHSIDRNKSMNTELV